jgi:hypothetical protein
LQLAIGDGAFRAPLPQSSFRWSTFAARTYFTAQITRQKKWAEDKSAHLFQRVMQSRQIGSLRLQVGS